MSSNGVPSPFGSASGASGPMTPGGTSATPSFGGSSEPSSPFRTGSPGPRSARGASSAGLVVPPARFASGTASLASAGPHAETRRSRATVLAIVIGLLGLAAVGVGCYELLVSIDVFQAAVGREPFVHREFVTLVVVGTLAVLAAVGLSIRGAVVSRPRWLPITVLVLSLVLPLPVAVIALAAGGQELADRTIIQAQNLARDVNVVEDIDAEAVDRLYERFERFGISLPGRDEVREILTRNDEMTAEET